jgi:hypothetical protein
MIRKDFFNEGVALDVQIFNGVVNSSTIVSVEVCYAENKHDMATITYAGFPEFAVTAYKGLPVYITFGNNEANKKQFYGYVAYVDAGAYSRMGAVNNSQIQEAKVVCIGTGYQLKNISNSSFKNVTLSKLVKTIARKHNMSYSVPNVGTVIPSVSQQNQSDWELLVSECNKFGYNVTASNSHINVYDPFSDYFKNYPVTFLYATGKGGKGKTRTPGTIMEFKGTFGDVTPYGNSSSYDVNTLDKRGKTITTSSKSLGNANLGKKVGNRFNHNITTQASSREHLKQVVKGYKLNSFPFFADVVVSGVVTPIPGSFVKVNNYDSKFDGYWVVESVEHLINTDHYITKLRIKTDSTIDEPALTQFGPHYKGAPAPTITNYIWGTEREMAYVY